MNRTNLAYRRTAAEGASGFGLLIALFDTLSGNLRRAAEAQRGMHIENRCREVDHALRIIAHLENCLPKEGNGDLTLQLRTFYTRLRHKLLDAQIKQSADLLEEQVCEVSKIRALWQQLDQVQTGSHPQILSPEKRPAASGYVAPPERTNNSWSA